MICEIYSYRLYGQPKLAKPKELKGIKQSFTAQWNPKCQCQCFIKDNDLWIKHRDFFSSSHKPQKEDIGSPLSYRMKKYFGQSKSEKFIYADNWGSIVLRNEAWIVFKDFVQEQQTHNIITLPQTMVDEFLNTKVLIENHIDELDFEWNRFFESVIWNYKGRFLNIENSIFKQ